LKFVRKPGEGSVEKRDFSRVTQADIHRVTRTRYVQVGGRAGKREAHCPDYPRRRWREFLPSLVCLEVENVPARRLRQVNRLLDGARHHDHKPADPCESWVIIAGVAPPLKYSRQAGGAKLFDFKIGQIVGGRSVLAYCFFPNVPFRRCPFHKMQLELGIVDGMNFESLVLGVAPVSRKEHNPGAGNNPMPQQHGRGLKGFAANAWEQKETINTAQQPGEKNREITRSHIVEKRRREIHNHTGRAVQGNHGQHNALNERSRGCFCENQGADIQEGADEDPAHYLWNDHTLDHDPRRVDQERVEVHETGNKSHAEAGMNEFGIEGPENSQAAGEHHQDRGSAHHEHDIFQDGSKGTEESSSNHVHLRDGGAAELAFSCLMRGKKKREVVRGLFPGLQEIALDRTTQEFAQPMSPMHDYAVDGEVRNSAGQMSGNPTIQPSGFGFGPQGTLKLCRYCFGFSDVGLTSAVFVAAAFGLEVVAATTVLGCQKSAAA
jgi:hypothetical protein